MTERERFLCMVRGETPDYVPIFGFPGAPGMSRGCMAKTHPSTNNRTRCERTFGYERS
jgi:hypothetical protein